MARYFSLITNVGSAQISNAVALGKTIKLTHMAVGDGGGTNPLPDVAQTKLVNETYRAMINSLSIDKENPNIIIAEFILPEDVGGFYVREVGVFDEAGNLVAVGNTPESYKAKMSEGSGAHKVIRVYIATSASDKIELKINPSVVLATREYVDEEVSKKADIDHSHDYLKLTGGTLTGDLTINNPNNKTMGFSIDIYKENVTPGFVLYKAEEGKDRQSVGRMGLKFGDKVVGDDNPFSLVVYQTGKGFTKNRNGETGASVYIYPTGRAVLNCDLKSTSLGLDNDGLAYFEKGGIKKLLINIDDFKSLIEANGWQKLPGGLIIQWGTTEIKNIGQATTNGYYQSSDYANFTIPFPNKCLHCIPNISDGATSTSWTSFAKAQNVGAMKDKTTILVHSTYKPEKPFIVNFMSIGY